MFGLRYHVASLAAVFLALAVGIMLGVAISGKVSDAEDRLSRDHVQDLEQQVQLANKRAEDAARQGTSAEQFVERAYAALMSGRLAGERVALLFLGPADGSLRSGIERTLLDAGAGGAIRVIALNVPVDPEDLQATLEGDDVLAAFADDGNDLSALGRGLGRELVEGGDTPLWSALQSRLAEERSGSGSLPADAVVVADTWEAPQASDGEDAAGTEATASLMEGLVSGASGADVPVIGVAESTDPPSVIDLYRSQGISSVDDVDRDAGRVALALLISGAEPGHYGVGEGAGDGVVPTIEPLGAEGG
jgi:Copper transport outer membrane protein, MctB